MITIRTKENLMTQTITGKLEKTMKDYIMSGKIPTRSVTSKDPAHKIFLVVDDWAMDLEGIKVYLWKGTQVILS